MGLIAGWLLLRSHSSSSTPADSHEPGDPSVSSHAGGTLSVNLIATELSRTDDLLRQGRYDRALAAYQSLLAEGVGSQTGRIHFRQAIALEGLARWDLALASYRRAANSDLPLSVRLAAEVAQGRIWIHCQKPTEARPLLCRLLLHTGQTEVHDSSAVAEARYLLALALARSALPPIEPGVQHDTPARVTALEWNLARLLEAESTPGSRPAQRPKGEDVVSVRRMNGKIEESPVRAYRRSSVQSLFGQLAEQAGLAIQWTEEARQSVAERSIEIVVEGRPLAEVLWRLTGVFGLAWRIADGKLVLSREEELDDSARKSYRAAAAKYALRTALVSAPDHPLAAAAYVELGVFDATEGKLIDAAAWFERAAHDLPRSAQVIEAHYNLGWTLRHLGEPLAARLAFFHAIDQAPGQELAALAYLQIGQIYLEAGESRQAIVPLQHAASSGRGTATESWAAVTLAAAHLQSGQPRAAHDALAQHRTALSRALFAPTAAFLDALARYRLAPGGRGSTAEGSELLSALLAMPESKILGPVGVLLQGMAYREIGLGERMAAIYQPLLSHKGPVVDEMICVLGSYQHTLANDTEARRLLAPVAQGDGRWAAEARLILADIDLQDNRAAECLQACAALLDKALVDRSAVLRLMGKAFAQTGDHARAARCFAGQRPQ